VCDERVVHPDPSPFTGPTSERHAHLDPVPASVSLARAFVRAAEPELTTDALDTLVLLTSELVTNAVLHARTPVRLDVVMGDEQVMVAVGDLAPVEQSLEPRHWSKDRPGGRGLALVADLSDAWGTRTHSGGKAVWFVLPVTQVVQLQVG
jgi:anti-sigma regulatory factor (Ser/Thr protein kinase)